MSENRLKILFIGIVGCLLLATASQYQPDGFADVGATWNSARIRTKRAVHTKTTDLLGKISSLARITNAVSLQAALASKAIPVDEVLAEMLNFAPLKLSDVAKFNGSKVSALMGMLKSIPTNFDSTDPAINAEKFVTDMNYIKEVSKSIGPLNSLPNGQNYFQKVKDFHDNFDFNTIQLKALFDSLYSKLSGIDNIVVSVFDSNSAIRTTIISDITSIYLTLGSTNELLKTQLDLIKPALATYAELQKEENEITQYEKFIELMKERSNVKSSAAGNVLVKKNIDALTSLSMTSQSARPDISFLMKMFSYRVHPQLISRNFTPAFIDGIVDMKKLGDDSKSAWLENMFKKNGKVSKMDDGLRPIRKVVNEVNVANDKLVAVSNQLKLSSAKKVQQLLANFTFTSTGLGDVPKIIGDAYACLSGTYDMGNIESESVTKTKTLRKTLASISVIADKVRSFENGVRLKDVENFQTLFVLTDTHDADKVASEGKTIIQNLQGGAKPNLTNFMNRVAATKTLVQDIGVNQIKDLAAYIFTNGPSQLAKLKTNFLVQREFNMYNCLTNVQLDQLAKAVKVVTEIRGISVKDASDVLEIVTAVDKFKSNLPTSDKVLGVIHDETTEASTALNKMPGVAAGSKALGVSFKSLNSLHELGEMNLGSLQTVDTVVQGEMNKLSIADKNVVRTKWGNHQSDLAALARGQTDANQFEAGLSISNSSTLKEYGSALGGLKNVQDVTVKSSSKSDALDTLISSATNQQEKDAMTAAKASLDKLAVLDMGYASAKTSVDAIPSFLDGVQLFLSAYLTENHDTTPQGAPGALGKERIIKGETVVVAGFPWWILLVGIVVVLLLTVILVYMLFSSNIRKRIHRVSTKRVVQFIKNSEWHDIINEKTKEIDKHGYHIAKEAHVGLMKSARDFMTASATEDDTMKKVMKTARWTSIPCNPETMVKIKGGNLIHANYIKTDGGTVFIATQGPIHKNEKLGNKDTCEDFWTMVFQQGTEFIVMLCCFIENGKSKCGQYIANQANESVQFGNMKITTVSVDEYLRDENDVPAVDKRVLILDVNGKSRRITHFHYKNWPDHSAPNDPFVCNKLLDVVVKSKKPIVVHCSAGAGRTVAFIGIKYMTDKVNYEKNASLIGTITKIRQLRWSGFQTWTQTYFVQVGTVIRLIKDRKLRMEDGKTQLAVYQKALTAKEEKPKAGEKKGPQDEQKGPQDEQTGPQDEQKGPQSTIPEKNSSATQ